MRQTDERLGMDLATMLTEELAEVVVLGQQCAGGIDAGSKELMRQWLMVLTGFRVLER